VCISLCTTLVHNTAQNSSDNFPSDPPDNHRSSDDVYWRGGETLSLIILTLTLFSTIQSTLAHIRDQRISVDGNQILQAQDTLAERHFSINAKLSQRHFGTSTSDPPLKTAETVWCPVMFYGYSQVVTGQLADTTTRELPTCGLVSPRTDQVLDWTARRLVKLRPVNSRTSVLLWFFGDSRSWVATHYCRNWSVVKWSWSSWNVWHSGTNEWKDETSQMPGGHSNQQWYEDRRSTCKDWFERTRHKMCRHQLNGWAWKNDEKVRWKYQQDREDSCAWVISDCFFYDQRGFASQVEKWEKTSMSLICSLNKTSSPTLDCLQSPTR